MQHPVLQKFDPKLEAHQHSDQSMQIVVNHSVVETRHHHQKQPVLCFACLPFVVQVLVPSERPNGELRQQRTGAAAAVDAHSKD